MYVSSLLLSSENKASLMGYSMRLGLTLVSNLNDLCLVSGWGLKKKVSKVGNRSRE